LQAFSVTQRHSRW